MILGLRLDGLPLAEIAEAAALAEAARLDFVLTGDPDGGNDTAVGRDALSIASFLMTRTREIGLVATVSQDSAPFNVARALASMDHLSGGRCGWVPIPGEPSDAARDTEHLDVVQKLFDSWDDDALMFDKAASVFADRSKVRRIRHTGAHFTVDGPLNAPRPVQGHPVLMQRAAAASPSADVWVGTGGDRAPGKTGAPVLQEIALGLMIETGAALTKRFSDKGCAGFLLQPRTLEDIKTFARDVAPILQAEGLLQTAYAPGDFRTRLGLRKPVNRFSAALADTTA